MRVKIDLIANVPDVEDLNVMLDQRERDDQRREPPMIVGDHAQQLGLLVSFQSILEVPYNMMQHVHVLTHRRLHGQGLHEEVAVLQRQLFGSIPLRLTDQPPHRFVVLLAMG